MTTVNLETSASSCTRSRSPGNLRGALLPAVTFLLRADPEDEAFLLRVKITRHVGPGSLLEETEDDPLSGIMMCLPGNSDMTTIRTEGHLHAENGASHPGVTIGDRLQDTCHRHHRSAGCPLVDTIHLPAECPRDLNEDVLHPRATDLLHVGVAIISLLRLNIEVNQGQDAAVAKVVEEEEVVVVAARRGRFATFSHRSKAAVMPKIATSFTPSRVKVPQCRKGPSDLTGHLAGRGHPEEKAPHLVRVTPLPHKGREGDGRGVYSGCIEEKRIFFNSFSLDSRLPPTSFSSILTVQPMNV